MMRTWLVLGVLAAFAGIVIDAQARAPGPPQGVTIKNPNDPSLDMTAPTVTISTPTSGTTHDAGTDTTLASLAGTSADASGIASCRWVNNLGGSGNATTSGAGGWAVSNLALTVGSNVLTVTCLDPGNNAGTDVLTVTRSSAVADGAHIWVDTDGGTCVDNASPVVYNTTTACGTIAAAAATSDAGDLIRVKVGTYAEVVTEATNGSAGNTITFVADGAVTTHGWVITGDYVRVIGFTIECGGVRSTAVDIQNADNVEIWNNTAQNCDNDDVIRSDGGGQTSLTQNSIFIGNTVRLTTGVSSMDYQIRGHSNLLAYNESDTNAVDFAYLFGQRIRVLNNYSHGIDSDPASHTDFIQTGASGDPLGFGQFLLEANFYADEFGSDHHCMNLELSAGSDTFHLYRRNVWSSNIAGGDAGQCYAYPVQMTDMKIYHETVSYAGLYNDVSYGSPPAARRAVLNNIYAPSWQHNIAPLIYDDTPAVHDYNLYFESGSTVTFPSNVTSEANSQRNVNPLFVNPAAGTRDFTLQSGSPARDAGSALTTTSGSGTGTTFNVATGGGGYFRGSDAANLAQYGGNLAPGDIITVGTDVVQIASISTDAITVTSSFTWANAEPVYLGTDTTPDIGAYPYKAGGYTLSATYAGSGTITITPNDASLVRWVVCYDSGVPYAVDNTSPYTCTAATGTFSARVYPLYPSKILWAVATP